MAKLELYNGREPHIIVLEVRDDKGKAVKKEFKIPSDFTVEDIERIWEFEDKLSTEKDALARWNFIFSQLSVAFSHHHPELTVAELKKLLTRAQALEIVNFIATHIFAVAKKKESGEAEHTPKKKDQPTS